MECGVSLPWWEMAASSYVTTLQPDYDADWSDKGSVTATVRAPSLSFVTKTVAAPQPRAARRRPGVPASDFEGEGARDTPVRGRIFVRGTRV